MQLFKNIKLSSFIAIGTACTLLGTGIGYAAGEWQNIWVQFNSVNLNVNGQTVSSPNLLYNDRTYVPLRTCAEMLGSSVNWDQYSNTANITGGTNIDGVKMKAAAQLLERFNLLTDVSVRLEVCAKDYGNSNDLVVGNYWNKDELIQKSIDYLNDTIISYNLCVDNLDEIILNLQILNIKSDNCKEILNSYGNCIDNIKSAYDSLSTYTENSPFDLTFNALKLVDSGIEQKNNADIIKKNYISKISDISRK